MENRNGLVVNVRLTQATSITERQAAINIAENIPGNHRITLGAGKDFDIQDFQKTLSTLNIIPHVAQDNARRKSALDGRTTRHEG